MKITRKNCTNNRLKIMCNENNEYYGAIGIYFPRQAMGHRRYLYRRVRRYDVIKDILKKNTYERIYVEREKTLKNLFKDYKNLSGVKKQVLKEMGFEITDDGKHYRLTYYGDDRYKTTIAKTGSDWREGKNIAATILKNMM